MRRMPVLTIIVAMVTGLLLAGCGGGSQEASTSSDTTQSQQTGQTGQQATGKVFTAQELAQYDGEDGQPAYVAVDGVVYDVTGSAMWPRGSHSSCPSSTAGRDLSEVMKTAPAGMRDSLKRFPVVGTLR